MHALRSFSRTILQPARIPGSINVRASIPADDGEYLSQDLGKRAATLQLTYLWSTDVREFESRRSSAVCSYRTHLMNEIKRKIYIHTFTYAS